MGWIVQLNDTNKTLKARNFVAFLSVLIGTLGISFSAV
jgi:hypothetical protein